MALKFVIAKLEEVAEALRGEYKKGADGNFYLQTEEDSEATKKVKEFRENNIALTNKQKELEAQIEEMKKLGTPEQIAEMKKKLQLIEDKKMIEAGKLDELVAQKVERMRQDYENQIVALKKAVDDKDVLLTKTNDRLSEVLIDSEITKAVTAVGGVRKDAMQDIIARGKRVWRLEDGKPVPKEGDKLLFGKDGKNAMTFDEWAAILFEQAPFLFEGSGGSGGGGNNNQQKNLGKIDLSKVPPGERLRMIHGQAGTGQAQK